MGRTLKRVPLDFADVWPINAKWRGYKNPHRPAQCEPCEGTGYSPEGALLFSKQWYGYAPFDPAAYGAKPLQLDDPNVQAFAKRNVERSPGYYVTESLIRRVMTEFSSAGKAIDREEATKIAREVAVKLEAERLWEHWKGQWSHHLIQADVDALLEDDRLYDITRVPINEEQAEIVKKKLADGGNSWLPEPNGLEVTADMVNAWSIGGMGHDAINQHICIRARCKREGIPYRCSFCDGTGDKWATPELKKAHEEWEPTEPPEGPGYQLWETTSEGSPVSPVFESLDALCEWAAEHATTFADCKATAEEWKKMLDDGFVYARSGNNMFC